MSRMLRFFRFEKEDLHELLSDMEVVKYHKNVLAVRVMGLVGLLYYVGTGIWTLVHHESVLGLVIDVIIGMTSFGILLLSIGCRWSLLLFAYAVWQLIIGILTFIGSIVMLAHYMYDLWDDPFLDDIISKTQICLAVVLSLFFIASFVLNFRLARMMRQANSSKASPIPMSCAGTGRPEDKSKR